MSESKSHKYWNAVQQASNSEGVVGQERVFMTSLPQWDKDETWRAGVVVEVAGPAHSNPLQRKRAGMLLVGGTHRLSTPEEIERYERQKGERGDECRLQTALNDNKRSSAVLVGAGEIRALGDLK